MGVRCALAHPFRARAAGRSDDLRRVASRAAAGPMRRRRLLAVGLLLPAFGALAAGQASLVMLERQDCPWCRRWLREVGEASWNLSNLGRRAPLRRVDVARGMPEDLRHIANWRFTPTFVLVAGGGEVGRITGYQADLFFWQQAEALLARLPQDP